MGINILILWRTCRDFHRSQPSGICGENDSPTESDRFLFELFLCNSGAEANENALKLASFITDRSKILAMKAAFHGRTSVAVAVTDNPAIQAPLNRCHEVTFIGLNDRKALESELETGAYAAVIVEGIQGVGGIQMPDTGFLQSMRELCTSTGTLMIVDEVQSGYGRTGKFFAHQHAGVLPDIITMAKGMARLQEKVGETCSR